MMTRTSTAAPPMRSRFIVGAPPRPALSGSAYATDILSSVKVISRSQALRLCSTWNDRCPTFQSAEPLGRLATTAVSRSLSWHISRTSPSSDGACRKMTLVCESESSPRASRTCSDSRPPAASRSESRWMTAMHRLCHLGIYDLSDNGLRFSGCGHHSSCVNRLETQGSHRAGGTSHLSDGNNGWGCMVVLDS